ncbi:MAG: hypothetical protein ACI85O_001978, partial [Saprospiraceae bacterium]
PFKKLKKSFNRRTIKLFFKFLKQKISSVNLRSLFITKSLSNAVEIDSEFWERDFVLSLGSENPRSVDISRFFKVQNED